MATLIFLQKNSIFMRQELCVTALSSYQQALFQRSLASSSLANFELILRSQGAFPPGFYLLREGWVYCPTPEAPQKGNADGTEGIFGTCRMRVGYGPAPGPTIKRPCAILARSVGRATNIASSSRSSFKEESCNLCGCIHLTFRRWGVLVV